MSSIASHARPKRSCIGTLNVSYSSYLRANPDAKVDTATRDDVQHGDVLGYANGVVEGQAQDGHPNADAFRLGRDRRHHQHGRRRPLARGEVVLAVPREVEAELLREDRVGD